MGWNTGDSSIVYDHTRVKSIQNIRRAAPQNSQRGIIMRSDPGVRKPRQLSARGFRSNRSASGLSASSGDANEAKEDDILTRGQRGFRNRRQTSKFRVAPPASRSKS